MSETTCTCGKPTRDDAYVCDDHRDELARDLGEMPWIDEQLDISITRQKGAGTAGGSGSTDKPLPWHDKASTAKRALHATLATWVRLCVEERVDHGGSEDWPADTIPAMSRWLLHRVDGLAFRDFGFEAVEQIANAAGEARRIVFWKRASRVYLGRCEGAQSETPHDPVTCQCACHDGYGQACTVVGGCGLGATEEQPCPGEVYADPGNPVGHCDVCARGYSVDVKRANLERELDDKLYTAAEIARLSTFLGLEVPRDRVRQQINLWHKRDRITPSGHDEKGSPRFRYGAVKALLYATYATRDSA